MGYLQTFPNNSLPFLQPTIDLVYYILTRVSIPIRASLGHYLRNLQLIDVCRSLHKRHEQPLTQMEGDMAMECPCPRIVSIELKHQVSKSSHVLGIPALRVLRTSDGYAIPRPRSIVQDVEVVAVKMHRMRAGVVIVDDDPDTGVCSEVDDVPFRVVGIGVVLLFGEEEHGIVVVALEGIAIHVEELLTSGVDHLIDGYVVGDTWFWKRDRIVGDGLVERIL